jgi:hypothetical protein
MKSLFIRNECWFHLRGVHSIPARPVAFTGQAESASGPDHGPDGKDRPAACGPPGRLSPARIADHPQCQPAVLRADLAGRPSAVFPVPAGDINSEGQDGQ